MNDHPIHVFASHDSFYDHAFSTFIRSTDQKEQAVTWLRNFLYSLGRKGLAIDAGAGNGILTREIAKSFHNVIAIEPNSALHEELSKSGDNVQLLDERIEEVKIQPGCADLVFCSHVLYYVPVSEWMSVFEILAGWTRSGGKVVITLQPENTDCMQFYGTLRNNRFPISDFVDEIESRRDTKTVDRQRQPSQIICSSKADLLTILEFLVNLTPFNESDPIPSGQTLTSEADKFARNFDGRYRLSSDQLFCVIEKA